MPYALRDGLSFCLVDNRPVFLDMRNDCYFRLPSSLEHRFIAYANENKDTDIGDLVGQNILEEIPGTQDRVRAATAEPPARSALERHGQPRLHVGALFEVFTSIYSVQRQLRIRPLRSVIDSIVASRSAKSHPDSIDWKVEQKILEASNDFRIARAYVPAETRCLLDSVAMIKFLASRGLHASIVFGVTSDPFSAHCWVQVRDLVLNDTVGHANGYTPIRVI